MKKLSRLFITLPKLSRLHLPCFFIGKCKHIYNNKKINGKYIWHYQIINTRITEIPFYGVHEVYFNEKTRKIISWTKDPVALDNYEDIEELRSDLEKKLSDIKEQSVLLESEIKRDLI